MPLAAGSLHRVCMLRSMRYSNGSCCHTLHQNIYLSGPYPALIFIVLRNKISHQWISSTFTFRLLPPVSLMNTSAASSYVLPSIFCSLCTWNKNAAKSLFESLRHSESLRTLEANGNSLVFRLRSRRTTFLWTKDFTDKGMYFGRGISLSGLFLWCEEFRSLLSPDFSDQRVKYIVHVVPEGSRGLKEWTSKLSR